MPEDICITGLGIVSALGVGIAETLEALKKSKTGIGSIQYLQTVHKEKFLVGEVKYSNADLMDLLRLPQNTFSEYTRTSLLGMLAAKQAVSHAGLSEESKEVAVISGTSVGGMDKTELHIKSDQSRNDFVFTHACGDSTDKITSYIGSNAYRTTLSTACSSAANAIMHAANLIKTGRAKQVIAGGVDALSKFTLNGFNSLMILDQELCRPFDKSRRGLNLGEGAAFLMLESESSAKERGAEILCRLSGYANSNDAYHQTASSPQGEGAYLAMTGALETAGFSPDKIDYINVHGTGTENNDLTEGIAMQRIFGEKIPPFSSTKAYSGHTLGAAAALEAVFSVWSITEGLIYPNLHFSEPIEQIGVIPETKLTKAPINHVLSNSFGFGGNNSTLIFSK